MTDKTSADQAPPTLPCVSVGEVDFGRFRVAGDAYCRIIASREIGPSELKRLIRMLQAQSDILEEASDD